jgi:hypothetical protein
VRLFLFLLLALVANLLFVGNAQAKTIISISPAIVERVIERGKTITTSLEVRNGSDSTLPISLYSEASNEFEDLSPKERLRYDASNWISFSEEVVLFSPGETKKISFDITVPENASSGGNYARIVVRALVLEQSGEGDRPTVIPELNVTVLLTVPGEIDTSLATITKSIFPYYVEKNKAINATTRIDNYGNVHNLVSPLAVIRKNNIEVQRLYSTPKLILPDNGYDFSIDTEQFEEKGVYYVSYYEQANQETLGNITKIEKIIVGPSITKLAILATGTWVLLFSVHNRKNVIRAVKILRGQ